MEKDVRFGFLNSLFFATSAILGYGVLPIMVFCCLEVRSMYEDARTSIHHLNKDLAEARQANHYDEAMEYKEIGMTYALLCVDMQERIAVLEGEIAAATKTEKDESENPPWAVGGNQFNTKIKDL